MTANENSKKIQSASGTCYRFGAFELDPSERELTHNGRPVPLPPKAFDALHHLVRKAPHLVRKDELMDVLWPSTHVSEANLTNCMVTLRKTIGHDGIQTVSRHGYRFLLPVKGEPGIVRETYEQFIEAQELIRERSPDSILRARDLLWLCLAEDPGFAPAWAWLGRCSWMLEKFGGNGDRAGTLAQAALRRAFAIDPDLACAHQFYTPVQTDMGDARLALSRLFDRLARHRGDPDTFTGLVQVLRFCGLLEESLDAHHRAMELDPTVFTSIPHTLFLMGNYPATIDSYGGRAGYYLDAATWAALGETRRSAVLIRERLGRAPLSSLMSGLMNSLLAVIEQRTEDAFHLMQGMSVHHEPEAMVYLARHYSYIGAADAATNMLRQSARTGFTCAPETLRRDPWLEAVRAHAEYQEIMAETQKAVTRARSFLNARPGGFSLTSNTVSKR